MGTEFPRGRISDVVTTHVSCGTCGTEQRIPDDMVRAHFASAYIKLAGWVLTTGRGWVCPRCRKEAKGVDTTKVRYTAPELRERIGVVLTAMEEVPSPEPKIAIREVREWVEQRIKKLPPRVPLKNGDFRFRVGSGRTAATIAWAKWRTLQALLAYLDQREKEPPC